MKEGSEMGYIPSPTKLESMYLIDPLRSSFSNFGNFSNNKLFTIHYLVLNSKK